jgi:hypothetical protein
MPGDKLCLDDNYANELNSNIISKPFTGIPDDKADVYSIFQVSIE